MFVTPSEELKTRVDFIKKLRVYLHAVDTQFFRVHFKKSKVIIPGTEVKLPEFDVTHVFNNGAMLAISHTIEDMAKECRNGELIVTFQELGNFEPRRQRYIQLAQHLNAIRIWGQGTPPADCPGVDFVPIFHPVVTQYWVVLFASKKLNAILVGKQINSTQDIEKKYFMGFYSLNPFVVQSMRRSFAFMSSGLNGAVKSWEMKCGFPKLSARDLDRFLPRRPHRESKHMRRAHLVAHRSEG
ncbi:MAG: DICT sensory domain-containing protein [Verrucomicrobiota bacterium]